MRWKARETPSAVISFQCQRCSAALAQTGYKLLPLSGSPKRARALPGLVLEKPGKIGLIGEPQLLADLRHGHVSLTKQLLGDSAAAIVIELSQAGALLRQTAIQGAR